MTSKTTTSRGTTPDSHSPVRAYLPFALVALIYLVGAFYLSYYTWGFNVWSSLPRWALLGMTGLLLLSALPPVAERLYHAAANILDQIRSMTADLPPAWRLPLGATLLLLLIFLLRSRALLFGDGFIAIHNTEQPWSSLFLGVHEYLKPLSVVLYKLGYVLFHGIFRLSAESAFAATSSIGGVIGWLGLLKLTSTLGVKPSTRAFILAAVCTSGGVLLFLGHMELYVWGAAGYIWFLRYSLQHREPGNMARAAITGAVAIFCNVMLVPAVAAVLILIWLERRHDVKQATFGLTPGRLLGLAVVGAFALAAILQFQGVYYGTVPILARPENPYTIFSSGHLTDLANQILFAAPLGVLTLVAFVRRAPILRAHPLLAAGSIIPFVVGFWIDTEIGAPRDWDLLSFFGLPLTLLGAVVFASAVSERRLRHAAVLAAALAAFLLLPRLYEQTHPDAALTRINAALWDDPHYQISYQRAHRCISWGALLHENLNRPDLAIQYYRRRLSAESDCGISWSNLGEIYGQQQAYDSAEACFGRAYALYPEVDKYRRGLIQALGYQSKWEEASQLLGPTSLRDTVDIAIQRHCGSSLLSEGKIPEALTCFRRADSLNPDSWLDKMSVGMTYAILQQDDSSLAYCHQVEALCPPEETCSMYQILLGDLLDLQRTAEIADILPRYMSKCPDGPDLDSIAKSAGPSS